jgi:hypothetical protein
MTLKSDSTVVLLFQRTDASEYDLMLVRALSAQASATRFIVVPACSDFKLSLWESCSRRLGQRMARVQCNRRDFFELGSANVEVRWLLQNHRVGTLKDLRPRLIIDLMSGIDLEDVAGVARDGVVRLWCDGIPESLECWSIVEPERSHQISVSVQSGFGELPVVVREAFLITTGPYPELDRRNAASRAITLLVRSICEPVGLRQAMRTISVPLSFDRRLPTHRIKAVMHLLSAGICRRARSYFWHTRPWFLAYRTDSDAFFAGSAVLDPGGLKYMDIGSGRFVADPCVLSHGGIEHVFVEEYPFDLRRGVISWCYLQQNGTLSELTRVLERPYHLSYPFVFESDGNIYMVPESSASRTVDLYRAVEFPLRWEFHSTLLKDVNAADATLHFDGNKWWMFVCIGEYGSSPRDELFLFSAPQPVGPWQPHKNNPVKIDASSARPAGRLFYRNGMLLRPAQDCSRYYGEAINLCRVTALNDERFEEQIVARIGPALIPGTVALHTISFSERLEVFDAKWKSLAKSPFRASNRR